MPCRATRPAALLLLAGCQSVDAGPDYDRAVEEIRRATGAASVFHPDSDSERVAARVRALLEGGLALSEAVELGLLNSPVLQASFHGVGMASADRSQAGLLTNPSLNAVLRLPLSGGSTGFEGSLLASLLDLWQVSDRERVAEHALEQRILQLAHEAVLLAAEIRTAYIAAVSAERLVEIATENRAATGSLVDLVEARLAAAATTAIDANLARLEHAATAIALRDAQLLAGEAARRLAALLGLPPDLDLGLQALPEWSPQELPTVEQLERLALERRLDVRAARSALARATAELERQERRVWRRVGVGVGAEKGDGWAPGPAARLELPLFDQNQAQIAKARGHRDRRGKILAATTVDAVSDVRSAEARWRAAVDALKVYRDEILPLAEATLEQARGSYRLGKTTILPVVEAQRQVLEARRAHVRRMERAATAASDVERATGTPREALFESASEGNREP